MLILRVFSFISSGCLVQDSICVQVLSFPQLPMCGKTRLQVTVRYSSGSPYSEAVAPCGPTLKKQCFNIVYTLVSCGF